MAKPTITMTASLCVYLVFVALCSLSVADDKNWPQWRGPNSDGIAAKGDYPVEWSPDKNVSWKYELPGAGASTPIIWKGNIILTGSSDEKNDVLCLSLKGEKKWHKQLGQAKRGKHRKATASNSSPVTDGQHIFAYFKSGELAALDFDGNVVWQKNIYDEYGKDTLWWDQGTSPVLTKNHVVIARMQTGNSFLVAFDKKTGNEAWKQKRDLEAPVESAQSYTTPVVVGDGDDQTIIVLGADHVTAHDAETGKQKWICGGLNPKGQKLFRSIASPVVTADMVIAPYARGSTLTAIKRGGTGDVTDSHVQWTAKPAADVPTPLVSGGKLFVLTDRGTINLFDVKTGEKITDLKLPRSRRAYSSSLALAGGHLYATNEAAVTHVVKIDGDELELVATNDLEDATVSTPVFIDNKAYVRTHKYLYCFTKSE